MGKLYEKNELTFALVWIAVYVAGTALMETLNETLGVFYCKGFDTFGPFKLLGGINKHHPDDEEVRQAVEFYRKLS